MRRITWLACAAVLSAASDATGDGERTPMIGGAVTLASSMHEDTSGMVGVELEAAWWWWRVGLAAEASGCKALDGDQARGLVLGASLRLRVVEGLVPSLLEPSDVEVGLELQAIVERAWWDRTAGDEPLRRGVGIALRFRGTTDDDAPRLITESRFFVRVLSSRPDLEPVVARTTMPIADSPRNMMVLIGIGAAFGGGESRYLERFQRRPFEYPVLRRSRATGAN